MAALFKDFLDFIRASILFCSLYAA